LPSITKAEAFGVQTLLFAGSILQILPAYVLSVLFGIVAKFYEDVVEV
jgi:hypothetical protein